MSDSFTAASTQRFSLAPQATNSEAEDAGPVLTRTPLSAKSGIERGRALYESDMALGCSSNAPSQDLRRDQLVFRRYQLVPGARLLLLDGKPVKLGSRAFDLLHILLCSRGRLVSKEDIVQHVWPHTTVEESNLRFQMGCLRKALGPDRDLIKTIPGRGYILATEVPVVETFSGMEFA